MKEQGGDHIACPSLERDASGTAARSITLSVLSAARSSVIRKLAAVTTETRRLWQAARISITRSEMPSLVLGRKTSLTMRQRLTPEIVCSTTTRTGEDRVDELLTDAQLFAFGLFLVAWSVSCRLITLKAVSLSSVALFDTRSARHPWPSYRVFCPPGWTQIHDLLRVFIDEEDVFVGVCFLLAACSAPFVG